jgi:hypothetical protein
MPASPFAACLRAVLPPAVALFAACGPGGPRVVEDPERGCRYVAPAGWAVFDGELRSRSSSLFTLRVFDLREADRGFRDGLPESILPQLEEWARSYYVVEGEPTRVDTTVGGLTALELTYAVRVRASDPPAKLVYWVVRPGERLFVMRAVFPPQAAAGDEPAVRDMLGTWAFVVPRAQLPPAATAPALRARASSVTMPIFRSSPPAILATSRIWMIPS